jgi:hypothetical protein
MPPADAGSGHILVANEGLTALATIMPPTFVGSEFRSPLARQLADLSMIDFLCQHIIHCEGQQI